eukprot:753953-Hanusia_phi.AAC.5
MPLSPLFTRQVGGERGGWCHHRKTIKYSSYRLLHIHFPPRLSTALSGIAHPKLSLTVSRPLLPSLSVV